MTSLLLFWLTFKNSFFLATHSLFGLCRCFHRICSLVKLEIRRIPKFICPRGQKVGKGALQRAAKSFTLRPCHSPRPGWFSSVHGGQEEQAKAHVGQESSTPWALPRPWTLSWYTQINLKLPHSNCGLACFCCYRGMVHNGRRLETTKCLSTVKWMNESTGPSYISNAPPKWAVRDLLYMLA